MLCVFVQREFYCALFACLRTPQGVGSTRSDHAPEPIRLTHFSFSCEYFTRCGSGCQTTNNLRFLQGVPLAALFLLFANGTPFICARRFYFLLRTPSLLDIATTYGSSPTASCKLPYNKKRLAVYHPHRCAVLRQAVCLIRKE